MNFFQITKQKIKFLMFLILISAVSWFVFNFLFGCLAILTSEPFICHSLSSPFVLIQLPYIAIELPYFIFSLFFDINNIGQYAGVSLILGFILETFYLYFLVCLFVSRKIITEKVPKLLITICILVFLYFCWIILFDMPKTLDRSYSYGDSSMGGFNTIEDPKYGIMKEKGIYPDTKAKGYYSLVWPWAIYKGNRSYPLNRSIANSAGELVVPIIYMVMLTFVVQRLFFKKSLSIKTQ